MLKAGLVGAGHLGKIHLRLLNQSDKYELVGFHDKDVKTEKLEAEFDTNILKILMIYWRNRHVRHCYAYCLSLRLRHESHEKGFIFYRKTSNPNAGNKGEEILYKCRENGIKAQVGHVERYNPAFIATKDFIQNPMFIEIHRLAEFNPKRNRCFSGSGFDDSRLDILLSIVKSKVKNIHASGVCVVSKTPDICNARIEFENGCVANLDYF